MTMRKRIITLAAMVAGLSVAGLASAQQAGTTAAQGGFSVENILMELSSFLPEDKAGFMAFGRGPGAPGDQQRQGQSGQQGTAQAGQGQGSQQGGQAGQRPAGINFPQFKRDPKLYLTAKQVDALLPVLQDLQKNPFPTPSLAKKVTSTLDATLTKQQKDAYDKFVKERDKAMEELRKQFASRQGQSGQAGDQGSGGFIARGEQGGQGDQAGPAGQQRQQRDPAELRKQMLEAFIKNLQEYRKDLK